MLISSLKYLVDSGTQTIRAFRQGLGLISRNNDRTPHGIRWITVPTTIVLSASLLVGCGGGSAPSNGTATSSRSTTPSTQETITLYNGQHPQLTQAIVSAFEKQTGIQVKVRTDDGIVLADQILQEGSHSPADVYLTENSPELMMLTGHHLLAKLPSSITNQIPSQYDSPTGNWVGVALRVNALVYNPSLISASQLPTSIQDLAEPQWKGKIAISPTDSDFVPVIGAVIATHGTSSAKSWLAGLKNNSTPYQDLESVVAAVNRGQKAVGVTNSYYWYRLQLEAGKGNTHSKLYFFPNHDAGGIENVSGAAVLASSKHKTAAEKFVSFLTSSTAQRILAAGDDYEYPARPGSVPNPVLPPLSQVNPAVINVVRLGNDLPAASLLQEVGLT